MIRILIVEDENPVADLLKQILEKAGYTCALAFNSTQAREYLDKEQFELILTDIRMPGESGLDLLKSVLPGCPNTAAIVITGYDDSRIAEIALSLGVYDYIIKPFRKNDVLISVANALLRRKLDIEGRTKRQLLEKKISGQSKSLHENMTKLRKSLDGAIRAIALTVEMRDPYTAGHQERVAVLASAIAKELGFSDRKISVIQMAGTVHDIGKISVPAEILAKPHSLTANEFNLIKVHSEVGFNILKNIESPWPIAQIVLQHHERMNGSGYPQGLVGENILMESRILAVSDVVEAMSSYRPYRPAPGIEKALREISENKGILYDSSVSDACLKTFSKKGFDEIFLKKNRNWKI